MPEISTGHPITKAFQHFRGDVPLINEDRTMDIFDVRKLAWDTKKVIAFLSTIDVGTVKSTYDLADDFITHHGVDPASDTGGVFYGIVNNMCAGFDYLISIGDASVERNHEGLPIITFIKHSGISPAH